jgi:cobalt/nickel transport system permease protein
MSVLPDYGFKRDDVEPEAEPSWPAVSAGTSVSGVVGGGITLALVLIAGFVAKGWGGKKSEIRGR